MPEDEAKPAEAPKLTDETPIETQHRLALKGKTLDYKVTAGRLPLKNDKGEIEANVFYVAYTLQPDKDAKKKRPLTFSFNGGPGSSSVWLHLGALGPQRVKMTPDGMMPPAPYELVANPSGWLEETDLVFIDPVGTGYSRAATKELGEKFWGVKGDIESMGEFIRLYLTRNERWTSPLFLVGESYGTTRAAGLAGHLIDHGIAFNGILLISSILNFQTAVFAKGNDQPNVLYLPTYCATAWYHGKLGSRFMDLGQALKAAEEYALGPYAALLAKGDQITEGERSGAIKKLHELTGLDPAYIDNVDLRIEINTFCKELLRSEKRTVGRLDSRFKGLDANVAGELPGFDPSMAAIRPPYTAMFNDYVRTKLGYKTDEPYLILGGGFEKWEWGSAIEGHPDTSEALRQAFVKNPHMKLFVASGYYDLATPYFATQYTLNHMGLDPTLRGNVSTADFEAGHMMYIHEECLTKLKGEAGKFILGA